MSGPKSVAENVKVTGLLCFIKDALRRQGAAAAAAHHSRRPSFMGQRRARTARRPLLAETPIFLCFLVFRF